MAKGISNVISAVLVVLVAVSAITIYSGWAPNLVRSVTDSTSNQTTSTIDCNDGSIEILSSKYLSGESNTSVVVRNDGRSDLKDIQVSAWNESIPMNKSLISSLEQGNFTTEKVVTTEKPTSIRVFSQECGSISDRLDEIEE